MGSFEAFRIAVHDDGANRNAQINAIHCIVNSSRLSFLQKGDCFKLILMDGNAVAHLQADVFVDDPDAQPVCISLLFIDIFSLAFLKVLCNRLL